MNKNNTVKDLLIIMVGVAIFAAIGYTVVNFTNYKQQINSLRSQNSVLEENRKRLRLEFAQLKKELENLKAQETKLNNQIMLQASEIEYAKSQAAKSHSELSRLQKDLFKTRKKIKELESQPANRTGDDLLNSLKIKTQL